MRDSNARAPAHSAVSNRRRRHRRHPRRDAEVGLIPRREGAVPSEDRRRRDPRDGVREARAHLQVDPEVAFHVRSARAEFRASRGATAVRERRQQHLRAARVDDSNQGREEPRGGGQGRVQRSVRGARHGRRGVLRRSTAGHGRQEQHVEPAVGRGVQARSILSHAGPRTTASARCTPFLEDFSSRRVVCFSPPTTPRFHSIPTRLDAFQLIRV